MFVTSGVVGDLMKLKLGEKMSGTMKKVVRLNKEQDEQSTKTAKRTADKNRKKMANRNKKMANKNQ